MRLFGWRLIAWQFGPWCLAHFSVVRDTPEFAGDGQMSDCFICIGPFQTRWQKWESGE